MNKYHVCIYPYNRDFDSVLDFSTMLLPKYEISALVSPRGWGLSHEKKIVGELTLPILPHLEEIDKDINCIWIPDVAISEQYEPVMIHNILSLNRRLSRLICCAALSSQGFQQLSEFCRETHCEWEHYAHTVGRSITAEEPAILTNAKLYPIEVPVITVAGVWEGVDKFYCSLAIHEKLRKAGYKVLQIGSKTYCEMFGFPSFPDFMLEPSHYGGIEQIYKLNHFIYSIVKQEKPDVLVISIPGAIQNFSDEFCSGFGILPYLVCQAVNVDFFLLCTFYNFNSKVSDFYSLLSESCRYRFDCPVDCVHMSNLFIDSTASAEQQQVVSNRLARSAVNDVIEANLKTASIPVYNLLEPTDQDMILQQIITKLSTANMGVVL